MATIHEKYIYTRMPKTGGNWADAVLQEGGGTPVNLGPQKWLNEHAYVGETKDPKLQRCAYQIPAPLAEKRLVISAIREPWSWYVSYWRFRTRGGWNPNWPLDGWVGGNWGSLVPFDQFIVKVLERKRCWLSELVETYGKHVDVWLDQEDLYAGLSWVNQRLNLGIAVPNTRLNVTANEPISPPVEVRSRLLQKQAKSSHSDLREKIRQMEKLAWETYINLEGLDESYGQPPHLLRELDLDEQAASKRPESSDL
jgi:hypothetical protein